MECYNSLILNEKYKVSLLNDLLPIEILDHIKTFIPIQYLYIYSNRIILIDIETNNKRIIKADSNIIDAIFTRSGNILFSTSTSVYNINLNNNYLNNHLIVEMYKSTNSRVKCNNIRSIDTYENHLIINNDNEIIINNKNVNIINNDNNIYNCKYLSKHELIIVVNENYKKMSIYKYNIKTNNLILLFKYNKRILTYLSVYNNEFILCFSTDKIYYNNKFYIFNINIRGAEFSGNNKYILLFGYENDLSIIKIIDKSTMIQIKQINLNENCRGLWLVSSNDKFIISETFNMLKIWCLDTFKLLKIIIKKIK